MSNDLTQRTNGLVKRADTLSVGDWIAHRDVWGETVIEKVTSVELVGDDVIINGTLLISEGNPVVCLGYRFTLL